MFQKNLKGVKILSELRVTKQYEKENSRSKNCYCLQQTVYFFLFIECYNVEAANI